MKIFLRFFSLFFVLVLLGMGVLSGCSTSDEDFGVVARVNGSPIYLDQLEAKYDLLQLDGIGEETPSVTRLRDDYGKILGDLIIQQLIYQELERQGISVTDEEVKVAEQEVRADYPEGAFEQVLVEEYIDIEFWREQLRSNLALERFFQELLRPKVQLSFEEAKTYYQEHISDFYLPTRIEFLAFRGSDRISLKKSVKFYQKYQDTDLLKEKFPQVQVHALKMREDRLPPSWLMALKELEPGQSSSVFSDKSGFQIFLPKKKIPGAFLEPSKAYPLVEKILMEKKLTEMFDEWLKNAMDTADVEVSVHLLEEFEKRKALQEG